MTTYSKRAEIDSFGYDVGNDPVHQGDLSIRWAKLTYEDDVLIARTAHIVMLLPTADIDDAMAAVNVDLVRDGFGPMPDSDIALVKTQAALVRTPENVAAASAHMEAVIKEFTERQAIADAEAAAAKNAADEAQDVLIANAVAAALAKQKQNGG